MLSPTTVHKGWGHCMGLSLKQEFVQFGSESEYKIR